MTALKPSLVHSKSRRNLNLIVVVEIVADLLQLGAWLSHCSNLWDCWFSRKSLAASGRSSGDTWIANGRYFWCCLHCMWAALSVHCTSAWTVWIYSKSHKEGLIGTSFYALIKKEIYSKNKKGKIFCQKQVSKCQFLTGVTFSRNNGPLEAVFHYFPVSELLFLSHIFPKLTMIEKCGKKESSK